MDWGIKQGAKLAELRMKKGYSKEYVARKIGSGLASIYRWESGTTCPKQKFLHDMAFLYNVPIETITEAKDATEPVNLPYVEEPIPDKTAISVIELMSMLSGKTHEEIIDEAVRAYAESFPWSEAIQLHYFCNTP